MDNHVQKFHSNAIDPINANICSLSNDNVLCIDENYRSTNDDGRRIYIHEQSFSSLASTSEEAAYLVYSTLAPIPILKTTHHIVVEDGVAFGQISSQRASYLMKLVSNRWSLLVTNMFHELVYNPQSPQERYNIYSLLQQNENIVATCYDVQYYTFATSELAAVRMYEDTEDIQRVKYSVRTGSGQNDLTIIKGHRLAVLDTEIGKGYDKVADYKDYFTSKSHLTPAQLKHIKTEVSTNIFEHLKNFISLALPNMDSDEQQLMDHLLYVCQQSINKGILKIN